jgi:hypothetical protein
LENQEENFNGRKVATQFLTHVGIADYTLPIDLLHLQTMTGDEAAHRYGVLIMDIFSFLNELGPHGYLAEQVLTNANLDGKTVKVTLRIKVTPSDYKRIQSEWHPLTVKDSPPDWEAV